MKVKVFEATGPVLDWMVARCEGWDSYDIHSNGAFELERTDTSECLWLRCFTPSEDWFQGGPILSKLGAENGLQLTTHVTSTAAACGWRASCDFPNGFYFGETALIAAMRCYVASRLGNEVEVPEELA